MEGKMKRDKASERVTREAKVKSDTSFNDSQMK